MPIAGGYLAVSPAKSQRSQRGYPPKTPPPARQNGPSLIGRQEIRLVISFGPKVQGTPADVTGYRPVVRGAWFEEREPWFAVDGSRLYLDTPREFESRVPRHLPLI